MNLILLIINVLKEVKARKNYKMGLTKEELLDATGEGVTVNYDPIEDRETYNYTYDPVGELGDFLSEKIHSSINYGRYWHGYLILFRPLLLIFNILQIRKLLFFTYLLLFIYFTYLVKKRFGKDIAVILALSLIFSGYFSASYSLESSSIFLTMMISSIILLLRIDKIKNFSLYLFGVACITNFVDYLTVPLITLGMLSGLYLLKLMRDGKSWKYCLKFVIFNSIIWLLGYASTWFVKWLLYDITINDGESMIKVGLTQSLYRMRRVNETVSNGSYIIYTIIDIISKSSLYTIISLSLLLIVNKFNFSSKKFNRNALSFLFLALLPIVWYFALANHTVMHYYFTYRQSLLFIIGILLSFYEILFKKEN